MLYHTKNVDGRGSKAVRTRYKTNCARGCLYTRSTFAMHTHHIRSNVIQYNWKVHGFTTSKKWYTKVKRNKLISTLFILILKGIRYFLQLSAVNLFILAEKLKVWSLHCGLRFFSCKNCLDTFSIVKQLSILYTLLHFSAFLAVRINVCTYLCNLFWNCSDWRGFSLKIVSLHFLVRNFVSDITFSLYLWARSGPGANANFRS